YDALHDHRREKALEAATPVELEEERAQRERDRNQHEPVVFPPGGGPDRPEELRDLRLREEEVGETERALQPKAGADEIPELRDRREQIERDDESHEGKGKPARAAGHVAGGRRAIAVCRGVVAVLRAGLHEDPLRDAA